MSSKYSTTESLSEGEIQFLASLASAVADSRATDQVSIEDAGDRFGPFRADQSDVVNKLREKGLITGHDDMLSLTESGDPLARGYHTERPDQYWYLYREFYTSANASMAHSMLCKRAYGKDLCQEGQVDMEALDDLLERLNLGSGDTVLDLGCGAGGISEYISDRTGAKVTGLDISPSAIEVAISRTTAKRDRLSFMIGDLNALDLSSNGYGAAISLDALYWVSDLDTTLGAILDAVRPGGQLAIHCSHHRDASEPIEALEPQFSEIALALKKRKQSYSVNDFTANNASFWKRHYTAVVDLRDVFAAEGNDWISDRLIREAEEVFLPAFDDGLRARYLFHVRV